MRRSVSKTPDQPLAHSRHQLAVLADQALRAIEEQHRAVEGAAIALNTADDREHAGVGRRRRDRLDGFAIEVDGRLVVSAERLASLRPSRASGTPATGAEMALSGAWFAPVAELQEPWQMSAVAYKPRARPTLRRQPFKGRSPMGACQLFQTPRPAVSRHLDKPAK